MLAGGVVLLAVAAGSGEFSRIQWSSVPATSWIALAYLIGPGSILGMWLAAAGRWRPRRRAAAAAAAQAAASTANRRAP